MGRRGWWWLYCWKLLKRYYKQSRDTKHCHQHEIVMVKILTRFSQYISMYTRAQCRIYTVLHTAGAVVDESRDSLDSCSTEKRSLIIIIIIIIRLHFVVNSIRLHILFYTITYSESISTVRKATRKIKLLCFLETAAFLL